MAAGLFCVAAGCGRGLYTFDPHEAAVTMDAGPTPADAAVPVDMATPPDQAPAQDAELKESDTHIKTLNKMGGTVDLGPALLTVPWGALDGPTRIILTLISLNGSPDNMQPGALGPVFQIAKDGTFTGAGPVTFSIRISAQSLGLPPERVALGCLDENLMWNVIAGYAYDADAGLVSCPVWDFSKSRICATVMSCSDTPDCPVGQRCWGNACQ